MELFYSRDIDGSICRLDADESGHCIKVLRHRAGDEISVIDGYGSLYRCRITSDSHKGVEAAVLSAEEGWGTHPYRLHLAVCPTKNNDRYEWFAEKACELGFDELSPVIGEHSERRILKTARVEKVLISDAGLDDVVLEMCKYVTKLEMLQKSVGAEQKEEFLASVFHFYRSEGEGDGRILTFMYALDGQMLGVNIGWNVYQDCAGILERNPQIRPSDGFERIDAEWLAARLA